MSDKPIPAGVNFALGAVAGSTAWLFVHPFELVKTRSMAHEGKNLNPFTVVAQCARNEGITGLYNGLSAGILRQCTYTALRVGIFNNLTQAFKDQQKTWVNGKIATGIYAGALSSVLVCPVEVSLVRMQTDGKLPVEQRRNYKHVFDAIYRILREEGVSGAWRGVGPTMARAMVITVTQLGTNEEVKEQLSKRYEMKGFQLVASSAMVSSVVVCLASNPLDAAKVRMQNQVIDPVTGEKPYKNLAQTAVKMVTKEGPLSLWKGFLPWYLRGGGHTIFLFLFLEEYKKMYQKYVA
jgi:solute carrier family 25 oxoglutarate transporter 11|eukprot:TRINITY_DN1816_c0_g1_i1.p1 TRINITY_DN1816_c0_g1~~TRINITY_DN1816_c0_g1_i1.p1  ORF type:complete len:319 (+),score=52.15 TRINITY_DN1816_c0_g1_i1:76-957(+)